jgi:hypothetical protein
MTTDALSSSGINGELIYCRVRDRKGMNLFKRFSLESVVGHLTCMEPPREVFQ